MANVIQVKRRSVDTTAPSSLADGEIAANTNVAGGGKLYLGLSDNSVAQIGGYDASELDYDTTGTGISADHDTIQKVIDFLIKNTSYYVIKNFTSDADMALTASEAENKIVIITDTNGYLTTTRNVTVPDTAQLPLQGVVNFTQHKFNYKSVSGTGIEVHAGAFYQAYKRSADANVGSGRVSTPSADGKLVVDLSSDANLTLSEGDSQHYFLEVRDPDAVLTAKRNIELTGNSITVEDMGFKYLKNRTRGVIKTVSVNAAGTGYAVDDILEINTGGWHGTVKVTTVDGGGGVTGLSVEYGGYEYSVATAQATQQGSGSGCTVDIDTVSDGQILRFKTIGGIDVDPGQDAFAIYDNKQGIFINWAKVDGAQIFERSKEVTGTYTLDNNDHGLTLYTTSATDFNITVGDNINEWFRCTVIQHGAGKATFVNGTVNTVRNKNGHTKTSGQYAAVTLYRYKPGDVLLQGETA